MGKFLKKFITPATSFILLMSMTGVGMADTTVSAEVSFIFNTFNLKINKRKLKFYSLN